MLDPIVNFSNFRHVDRPICLSQMSRKWSQAAWPVPSFGEKDVVPSSWNMRQSGAGPPHSANQPSTSAAFVTCAERAVRADGASTARGLDVRPGRDHLFDL